MGLAEAEGDEMFLTKAQQRAIQRHAGNEIFVKAGVPGASIGSGPFIPQIATASNISDRGGSSGSSGDAYAALGAYLSNPLSLGDSALHKLGKVIGRSINDKNRLAEREEAMNNSFSL